MTLIAGIPGLIALLVCLRRGPERALLNVYIPTLLLLPDTYHWMITGHLSFNETAIIPIAAFLIAQSWRDWRWSFTDLLVLAYLSLTIVAEYVNKDFHEARNAALNGICTTLLPYIAAKSILPREDLCASIAQRIVACLTIVSIVSVYEFRMEKNPFDMILGPLFPGQYSAVWISRYGFLRPAGPFGHAIAAGLALAIGYRFARWLGWGGYWPGNVPLLPLSKTRFCQICLIGGSIMTLSRGPWLGAAVGAVVIFLGRARNRSQAIITFALVCLLVGIPVVQGFKSYVWVAQDQAGSEMQQTAAYRHDLIERYITIVEERPVWGWGRYDFPVIDGMKSIDNGYLLIALTYGEYVLAVFVALLLWMIIRLLIFCRSEHGAVYPGSVALTFLAIYVIIVVTIFTVSLGAQLVPLLFLVSGWSDYLILAPSLKSNVQVRSAPESHKYNFQRVMA
ncbi:MAG: O-antigen ligase family protein [Candidatus Binataceae bacterium]|jgi:hypothetical protein